MLRAFRHLRVSRNCYKLSSTKPGKLMISFLPSLTRHQTKVVFYISLSIKMERQREATQTTHKKYAGELYKKAKIKSFYVMKNICASI